MGSIFLQEKEELNVKRLFCLFTAFLASFGSACLPHSESTNSSNDHEGTTVVKMAAAMDGDQRMKYVKELAEKNDIVALKALCKANLEWCTYATEVLATQLSAQDLITLCRQTADRDNVWLGLFEGLSNHESVQVIPYIEEVVRAESRYRVYAYLLCESRGWPDLIEYAYADQLSTELIVLVNQPWDLKTLGDVARRYINTVTRLPTGSSMPPGITTKDLNSGIRETGKS